VKRLQDVVVSRAKEKQKVGQNFFSRLAPEAQEELLAIRKRFQRGELGSASSLADIIVQAAAEQGWRVCGPQGMRVWLARRD